jgi:hypothetical protein
LIDRGAAQDIDAVETRELLDERFCMLARAIYQVGQTVAAEFAQNFHIW